MSSPSYSAPALEKGLKILEFLAGRTHPANPAEIAASLGRSKAEIYRMLLTLEARNYIRRDEAGNGYEMTSRLFELGMKHPSRQQLIGAALPHMQVLARETGQSCHLTVISEDSIVAAARAEAGTTSGFAVKVGFRVSAVRATSTRVIYAFQTQARQAEWIQWIHALGADTDMTGFLRDAQMARTHGYLVRESYYTVGVTDLVAPVFGTQVSDAQVFGTQVLGSQEATAIAALVIPFMDQRQNRLDQTSAIDRLRQNAAAISAELA